MNKIILIALIIVVAFVVIIFGGSYFYKNTSENNQDQANNQNAGSEEVNNKENEEVCQGDECFVKTDDVFNVIFQKAENNLLYFYTLDDENEQSLKMSEDTSFTEVKFDSETLENIGEREVELSYFKEGDNISIVVTPENEVIRIIAIINE